MDKKTFTIGVLSIIAAVLLAANLIPEPRAEAQGFAIKDTRYQLITTRSPKGGDTLYVVDNSTGLVANLTWDNGTLRPVAIEPLTNLFK
ncbi:MAG: hypothetical protein H7144_14210 [Burkholderiales bacterium]|nr:hypothetical protein [Phycisphaerae bacterium]